MKVPSGVVDVDRFEGPNAATSTPAMGRPVPSSMMVPAYGAGGSGVRLRRRNDRHRCRKRGERSY